MSPYGGKQRTENLVIRHTNEENKEKTGNNSYFFSGARWHSALFEVLDLKMFGGNIR